MITSTSHAIGNARVVWLCSHARFPRQSIAFRQRRLDSARWAGLRADPLACCVLCAWMSERPEGRLERHSGQGQDLVLQVVDPSDCGTGVAR